jgi:hypothetical protein
MPQILEMNAAVSGMRSRFRDEIAHIFRYVLC